jgi:S-adenosylmethionine hydrolase
MARPVIALLTDFGVQDHYVGSVKAVILGICPEAAVFDITHDIPPQDILAGALELEAVVPFLPAGAVVVAVVDPGVGSARRAVAVQSGQLRFVGPDNGLLDLAVRGTSDRTVVEIVNRSYTRDTISRTFEGRDRFAPAAAWLATGIPLHDLGPPVGDMVSLRVPEPAVSDGVIDGLVLRVDRFGNLVTNIGRDMLNRVGPAASISVGGATVDQISETYADLAHGALGALVGSTERLEIAVNGGSASGVLAVGRGTPVQVRVDPLRDTMRRLR